MLARLTGLNDAEEDAEEEDGQSRRVEVVLQRPLPQTDRDVSIAD